MNKLSHRLAEPRTDALPGGAPSALGLRQARPGTRSHRSVHSIVWVLVLIAGSAAARGQSSSLFTHDVPNEGPPLTLAGTSFTYQAVEPLRAIKLHDVITVIVDEKSQVTSQADVERRKQYSLNAQLKDWVELDGLSLKPAPQKDGDPTVNGTLQAQARAKADLETHDGMKFRIAANVVDIRPNGHLVLEAHRKIRNNEELWIQSLSGIVSPDDVLPNRTVLSEDVAELHIDKYEEGHVRDGYRRGWLYRLIDRYGMF